MSVGRVARRLVGAAVLAAVLVVAATVVRVWQVAGVDDRPRSDAIIVLGASQYNGRPSEVLEYRLRHALTLYRAGVAPRVVTVGGNRKGDLYTEAGTGKRWLADHGVPGSALLAVPQGNDTLQSMQAAGLVFDRHGWTTAVVVTDPWHELRSAKMAEDQGITVATSPVHSGPAVRGTGTELRYIARETAAYLYYRVLGTSPQTGAGAM